MKTVNIVLEDKDYAVILKAKDASGLIWRDFIVALVAIYNKGRVST